MTSDQLKQIFTHATDEDIDSFLRVFKAHAAEYDIETPFQENAFLAQVLAEVGTKLRSVRENMNYKASVLKDIFGYFKRNPGQADKYGRTAHHKADQQAIANRAYADRIDNGNVDSGDGWHFRGGGFFQLTGRGNYEEIAKSFPKPMTAEQLAERITEVEYGLISAMAFWQLNHCYKCDDINEVTKVINRHTDSYDKRKRHYHKIAGILA